MPRAPQPQKPMLRRSHAIRLMRCRTRKDVAVRPLASQGRCTRSSACARSRIAFRTKSSPRAKEIRCGSRIRRRRAQHSCNDLPPAGPLADTDAVYERILPIQEATSEGACESRDDAERHCGELRQCRPLCRGRQALTRARFDLGKGAGRGSPAGRAGARQFFWPAAQTRAPCGSAAHSPTDRSAFTGKRTAADRRMVRMPQPGRQCVVAMEKPQMRNPFPPRARRQRKAVRDRRNRGGHCTSKCSVSLENRDIRRRRKPFSGVPSPSTNGVGPASRRRNHADQPRNPLRQTGPRAATPRRCTGARSRSRKGAGRQSPAGREFTRLSPDRSICAKTALPRPKRSFPPPPRSSKTQGRDHPDVADALNNLAAVYGNTRRLKGGAMRFSSAS